MPDNSVACGPIGTGWRMTELYSTIEGRLDGPTIMLHTSLGCTHRMWDRQMDGLLTAGFRVVRYDYRGHGRSGVTGGSCSLADLGADALAVLAQHDISAAAHVGLSLGGMVAMWLAENAQDSVSSLVLCCTSAQVPPQLWRDRAGLVRAEGTAAVADVLLPRWLTPEHSAAHPDDVSWLREQVLSTSPSGYASGCEAMATMDIAGGLAGISAPSLVVAGAQDPATPVDHAELIVSRVPRARLTVVDPGAHLLNVERPDVVTRLITGHLASTAPGPR